MKKALITGISGQDGAYLSKLLLEKGYIVIGGDRRTASGSLWRLDYLGVINDIEITNFELAEFTNIYRVIEKYAVDEIYNLAAQSFVAASFEMPIMTSDITGLGACRILECIRKVNPETKFYQASSSEMFGKSKEIPQNENTPFHPRSPYGVAKLYGHWISVNYREAYDMFTSSGISFNHESPLRGEEFVTRKITLAFARIKYGLQDVLEVGNLEAKRDWGFAADYVLGMWLMLQQEKPDDYVLATGQMHSVREFVEAAAPHFGYEIVWEGQSDKTIGIDRKSNKVMVRVNPALYRPAEVHMLVGDSQKAREALGWKPKVAFDELVKMMAESDFNLVSKRSA